MSERSVAPTGGAARRLPPTALIISNRRLASSRALRRRVSSSTHHSKKPIALGTSRPSDLISRPSDSSVPPSMLIPARVVWLSLSYVLVGNESEGRTVTLA